MAETPAPYLQEFALLDQILSCVPHRSQHSVLSHNVEWTCIDVTVDYVVIGTNSSVVCLYDRHNGQVKKLNVRLKNVTITKVKLIDSVDYEVAVGTSDGQLFIYVLPSDIPGQNKTLQVFNVNGLHSSAVSCIEWSMNAMKVFSGDQTGLVICTEIDYLENKSKSYSVCEESHEIVQLHHAHRMLLVSTAHRTVCCIPGCLDVTQIGSKNRKTIGPFGAVFQLTPTPTKDPTVFVSRPGLRLWQAKCDGKVSATYIFKDLVTEHSKNVALLPDTIKGLIPSGSETYQFGPLLHYQDTYLVSYHGTELYVIDPVVRAFTSYHTNLGYIEDVAVCEDEVFILRKVTGRVLIRLAFKPEPRIEVPSHLSLKKVDTHRTISSSLRGRKSDTSPAQVWSDTASKMSHSFIDVFKGVGEKLQSVQEGRKMVRKGSTPPWGAAGSKPDVNRPMTRSTGSNGSSVDSAQELSPTYVPSPDRTLPESVDPEPSGSDYPATVMEDSPPIVTMDGDQLTVIKIEHSPSQIKNIEQTSAVSQKCDSADATIKDGSVDPIFDRRRTFEVGGQLDYEELVFSPKTKRKKKKVPTATLR